MKRKIILCLTSALFLLCSTPISAKANIITDTYPNTPYTIQTVITDAVPSPNIITNFDRASQRLKRLICATLPEQYYGVFLLPQHLPMMAQPLAALVVHQAQLRLLQLGQLNPYPLPKTGTLPLHMQQQHIRHLVLQKTSHKVLLFHVVKMALFPKF